MSIIILILILLFLIMVLPYLMPLFALVAVITVVASIMRAKASGRFNPESGGRRIEYTDGEEAGPFRHRTDEVEAPDVLIERPASVRDEAFWEKDHTVYDVPFEETDTPDDSTK